MSQEDFARLHRSMEQMTMQFEKLDARIKSVEKQPAYLIRKERSNPMHHKEYWEVNGKEYGGGFQAVQRRNSRDIHKVDPNLRMKPKLPKFYGSTNSKEYIQWERQVDHVFDCCTLSEEKKVKLIVSHLRDYAIIWWDKLFLSSRNLEHPIDSWNDLKQLMREHFVPKLFYNLRTLRQGSKNVEAYYMEMQKLLDELDLYEDEMTTMARFFRGLNKEIATLLDLQLYGDLDEMVHLAIKIEKHLQRKSKRYTKHKPISIIHSSLENVSLPITIQPNIEVESGEIKLEMQPTHVNDFLSSRQLDCKDLFDCNPSTIVIPTHDEVHVDVCELGKKAQKAKTKACELIEKESCEKMSEKEKHEISLWPKEKNERKAKNMSLCETVCEVKYVLFSKQNIFYLLYKGTCFLTGELKPCFSSVSFEFLQEAKTLIEKLDSKFPSKVNNGNQHMDINVNTFIERQNSKFASKFIHGSKHKVFKLGDWVWKHYWKDPCSFHKKPKWRSKGGLPITSHDYKIALQGERDVSYIFNAADFRPFDVGDPFDLRTNPLEEGENDMNSTNKEFQ